MESEDEKIKIEREKLAIEREKLELERHKAGLEKSKTRWTVAGIFSSAAFIAVLGLFGQKFFIEMPITWLTKEHEVRLNRDLAKYQSELQKQSDAAKAELAAKLNEAVEKHKADVASEKDRQERSRAEVRKWASPILDTVISLERRLQNIVTGEAYVILKETYDRSNGEKSDWSIDHSYMIQSTLYLFGRYFCWTDRLRESLNFELFNTSGQQKEFFDKLDAVSRPLADWPLVGISGGSGQDEQVFAWQQRAMGEALFDSKDSCLGFKEFSEKTSDPNFKVYFQPMTRLLLDVSPEQKRFMRLKLTLSQLCNLRTYSERLLGMNSGDLKTECPN